MSKSWSSGNSYLRLLSSLPEEPNKVMTISTLSVSELQSVLETILKLDKGMSTGKANLVCHTNIRLSVEDSREMCS